MDQELNVQSVNIEKVFRVSVLKICLADYKMSWFPFCSSVLLLITRD